MKAETYIKKAGSVYGVSSKYGFGTWEHIVHIFYDADEAVEWLQTEEFDSRERQLMSRDRAIRIAGIEAIEWAESN